MTSCNVIVQGVSLISRLSTAAVKRSLSHANRASLFPHAVQLTLFHARVSKYRLLTSRQAWHLMNVFSAQD